MRCPSGKEFGIRVQCRQRIADVSFTCRLRIRNPFRCGKFLSETFIFGRDRISAPLAKERFEIFYGCSFRGAVQPLPIQCRYLSGTDGVSYAGGNGNCNLLSFSASVGAGYYLYKGLSLSVGLEPTYYVWDKTFFDLPAFIRLGYDFKSVEVALAYRVGTLRNFHLAPFQGIHLSQWELSVYVPLWRRND